MKNSLLIGALLCFFSTVRAQVNPQMGARSAGLANTGLTLTDVFAVYNNPGAFGAMEKTAVGINYQNRFLLTELSTQSLAFGHHFEKAGNIGVHFQHYGFNLYQEIQGGLTYATQLHDNFYAGVGLNFHHIRIAEGYGSRFTASGSLGLFYKASESISFGMRVQNLSRTQLADFEDERLPTRFGLGMTYAFSEKLKWTVEAEKPLLQPLNIKSALEIQPHDILYLRFGVNSYPFQSAFGVGLALGNFHLDLATQWHNTLGIRPALGLKYRWN